MLCWEETCLQGPPLTPPSLLASLPQPPSAELFHYDSTNAVNWGMRGEAVGLGSRQGGGSAGAMGLPPCCRQLQKWDLDQRDKGRDGGVPAALEGAAGGEGAAAHVCFLFVSHRVQGKMALRRDCHLEVTPRGGPREVPLCAPALLGRSFALFLPSSPFIPIPTSPSRHHRAHTRVPSPVLGSSVSLP